MAFKLLVFSALLAVSLAGKPYHPPPSYGKGHYGSTSYKPKYEYSDIPSCSKNTTRPWCLDDSEYPTYDLQYALEQHYDAVLSLYKDVVVRTENSVDGLLTPADETYLCPSVTGYIQPLRAVNVDGKWRVIVNRVEVNYYKFTQSARIEECDAPAQGKPCPLVPSCYDSKCVQKNIYHRFLIYDPSDYYFPFAIESFKLPASCACLVGAFSL